MTASPVYGIANVRFRERFASLPDKLKAHIYRTRDVGLELASRHGIDEERVELAILGHDVARAAKRNEILRLADGFGMSTLDVERRSPITLHGPVGAELLRHEDGVDDEDILAAVRWHTTGHPSLTPLGLLVFIADKLEPRKIKSYPYQPELRDIANESLHLAVLELLCRESARRLERRQPVHPASIATINALLLGGAAKPHKLKSTVPVGES
jgi:predicted HD superfamily hydrolase involved in NAD metabolism